MLSNEEIQEFCSSYKDRYADDDIGDIRRADEHDKKILDIVNSAAATMGVPAPEVLIHTGIPYANYNRSLDFPNAKHGVILIAKTAPDFFNDEELTGLILHEIAHGKTSFLDRLLQEIENKIESEGRTEIDGKSAEDLVKAYRVRGRLETSHAKQRKYQEDIADEMAVQFIPAATLIAVLVKCATEDSRREAEYIGTEPPLDSKESIGDRLQKILDGSVSVHDNVMHRLKNLVRMQNEQETTGNITPSRLPPETALERLENSSRIKNYLGR